jgi:hypothetical protein
MLEKLQPYKLKSLVGSLAEQELNAIEVWHSAHSAESPSRSAMPSA